MNLQALIQRATNRAAIMANLANGGGDGLTSSSSSSSQSSRAPAQPLPKVDTQPQRVTEQLYLFLGLGTTGGDEKTKRGLAEQLENKSIVLDNTKAQLEASKSSTRMKRSLAREKTTSNTFLKKRKLLNSKQDDKIPLQPLQELNRQWRSMIAAVARDCSTLPQLQARVGSCTLIGAYVTVHTAAAAHASEQVHPSSSSLRRRPRPRKKGKSSKGKAVSATFDDPYPLLAPAASTPATAAQLKKSCGFVINEGPAGLWVRTTTGAVRRFGKADHVIAAHTGLGSSQTPSGAPFRPLPDAGAQTGLLCVLYGRAYTPFSAVAANTRFAGKERKI